MASEEQVDLSVQLPPELGEWLHEQATAQDTDADELLQQLLSAYRTVTELDEDRPDYDLPELLDAQSEELDARFDAQHEEFMELVEDVRERVIQVKHETDGKAPVDHTHEALEERLARVDELAETVEELDGRLETVRADLDAGFENYEDILEYLVATTDDIDAKLLKLARVTVDVRAEVTRLAAAESRRAGADALKLAANREGIERGKCEECDSTVTLSLLTEAECPHCASSFSDVERGSTFGPFGSHRLVTGDPPALPESDVSRVDDDLVEDFLDDDGEDAPEFQTGGETDE
ncbi:hypothetical protein [Haloarchaeobius sp. HME9146]|uniref:hypothetical protein n=1 Tax=Haloarchaeobius sp. HME9146 TaxID=2978732 RepID=UPI0021C24190|nr:hypothetical protein [Haloarchaeobius sp. HME9146]MCT9097578.1 hypothetical protein [Haloarchaeobius sp. HME9146]